MLRMGRGQKSETPSKPAPAACQPHVAAPLAQEAPPVAPSVQTRAAMTDSEMLSRDIREGSLNGFIGAGTLVKGDAIFRGMLRIDGQMNGHVTSEEGTLIVSSGGRVDANIEVAVATINGVVNGDIVATKRIELGRTARVTGNLQTPALVIEQGAVFEGVCKMQQMKEAQEKLREQETLREKETRTKPTTNGDINAAPEIVEAAA